MQQSDFFTDYAHAMTLNADGKRLIARQIIESLATWFGKAHRTLDAMARSLDNHQHLPPI
jgi:hypothetical protein